MTLKLHITPKEFAMIQKAIESTLNLYMYDFIEVNNEGGHYLEKTKLRNIQSMAMSKEVFFGKLKGEFIIE